ncbi:MAG: AraC family transcriptional regulator [Eubacteriales bacterium]
MASVIFGGTITVEEATNIYQIVEAEEILKAYLEEKYEPDEYWIINRTYNELIIMFKKNNVKNQMLWRNMKEIFREARITVTMALYQYPQSHKTIHITDNKLKSIVRDLMNIKNHVFYYGDGYDIAEQNYEEIRRVKEKYVYAQHKNQVGDGLQKLIAHSSGNRSVLLELLKTYVLYYFEKFGIEYSYTEIESRIRYCVMSVASLEELGEEVRRLCSEYFMTKEEKSQSKYHIAQEMKQYIDTNYADNITNLVLEQKYGFVSSYLRQIFQQEHKISPMEYLQKVRIEQSKLLINNSKGKSFKAVALAVGFNDSMYFSKVFRKMVGMTPSEYKDSLNGNSFE